MSFPPAFIDELRARVSLAAVAGQRVTFDAKKSNPRKRDYWACCPFHVERTPSFHVDDAKGFYHCFGCGAKGDAIGFVMAIDNLTFTEAVARLAAEAGLALPARQGKGEEESVRLKALCEALEKAARFFTAALAGREGEAARAYLEGRGVGPELQEAFGLGFAPQGGSSLYEHLRREGFETDLLAEAGLVVAEGGRPPYDRFRDRIIFPIRDAHGRLAGFGGRTLKRDPKVPKYLNSPETPLFRKGAMLFNLDQAGRAARGAGTLIVAEGYMDVIALHRAGYAHAVAPLGTALTERQLALLWRVAPEPILCFDGDEAGRRAARRAAEIALPHVKAGRSLRFALLPEGLDPDDLLRRHGRGALQACLAKTDALIDFLWEQELASGARETPEQRAALEERVRALVGRIGEPAVRQYYGLELGQRLRAHFGFPSREGRGRRISAPPVVSPALKRTSLVRAGRELETLPPGFLQEMEAALVATLIECPMLIERLGEALAELIFCAPELDKICNELTDLALRGESLDSLSLRDHLRDRGLLEPARGLFARDVVRRMAASWAGLPVDEAEPQWRRAAERLKRGRKLKADLDQATQDLSRGEDEITLHRLRALAQEWQALTSETLAP